MKSNKQTNKKNKNPLIDRTSLQFQSARALEQTKTIIYRKNEIEQTNKQKKQKSFDW